MKSLAGSPGCQKAVGSALEAPFGRTQWNPAIIKSSSFSQNLENVGIEKSHLRSYGGFGRLEALDADSEAKYDSVNNFP